MTQELADRVALVTGGGKGIGAAISRALAAMGAKVTVNYRSDAAAAETVANEIGGGAVKCDVADGAAVEAMIKSLGRVDILVNNAGAVRDKLLLRMTEADWDDIIATDLTAAFHTTKATLAGGMLRSRWGRIVNMASVVGITGNPGQANYAAAKAGLIGFTKAIAKEVGSRGITCNAVAPGYVRTELTSGSLTEEMVAELVRFTPLQREGTPEDVAAAVAFLCSPAAGFITAHTLVVDGGLSV
ncbi:MAG: SDR family oxidoreductase [Chloroflexi bacterium]|nr:MAG: SDR family oxidoreductase [Chloroflexota bacterium]TMD55161.1 MAG: SDR family oxidoreductase [Chloroflexota bacterium]